MKTLYHYQEDAYNKFVEYYANGNDGDILIALPTGTGKGTLIAETIRRVMTQWHGQRILALTHVHTLISQNHSDLLEQWPTAPAGIYSAGLGRKEAALPIVFGGVQSVVKMPERFGHRDLVIIDEAHLISPRAETTYQKVLAALRVINPSLRVIGLSATPYRLGQGLLTEDGIFDDIVCDWTTLDKFNQLLNEGFLLPPIPKRTSVEIDVSDISIRAGEFDQSQLAAASKKVLLAHDRRSWLVFTDSIENCDVVTTILKQFGIDADSIHSERGAEHNKQAIKRWKKGTLRCAVSKNMLTTGVNNRACDFIGMLRATGSASLWVQMLGRGTRTSPETGKTNCLVADFAGNTRRLGPINDPLIPSKPGKSKGTPGSAPIRICDQCGVYNHAAARYCIQCNFEFPLVAKLTPKLPNPPVIRVSYHCGRMGLTKFDEWVMLEHKGFPRKKARDWWRERSDGEPPESTDEALSVIKDLKVPRVIHVWTNRTYPEVTKVVF
jgi:DNA repair protein RadD